MSHAKLSPSAAERWMVCPGSVVLSEGMPERTSAFAEEGTEAHALAERLLTESELRASDDPKMVEYVSIYVDHVLNLADPPSGEPTKLHIEQRVKVNDEVYGTADAVVWQPVQKHLHVCDLKYGAGVAVEVHGNLQLKIYALATLLTFGYPAEQVTATIVQPRCPHSDGPVRSITFDVVDLIDFHADLIDAVGRVQLARVVNDITPHLAPSEKGCRWCLASPKCPKLKSKAQELAKRVFAKDAPYNAAELAETLDYLPILEGWIKNTREFAYEVAEKGDELPGYKLVEKRATRKWCDEDTPWRVLPKIFERLQIDEDWTETKLKSPATIEKLLPKEARELLDDITVKESSGHTLVHESDKRPAIKVDAASAFANS